MRYEFKMTLPFSRGLPRGALATLGQNSFERALGGPDRVLLLALDLLAECCDRVDVFQQDYRSKAEQQWGQAAIKAHEAVLVAAGKDLKTDREFRNEYLEHAFLTVTPYASARYGSKPAWIGAYLTRLQELKLEATDLLTPAYGESAYEQDGAFHPIWCADQLFVDIQASNEWPRRPHPVGQHAWFAQLRAELRAAISAAGHGDADNNDQASPVEQASRSRLAAAVGG